MGNAHQVVVHNVGKVIGGHPIGLDEDLVVHLAVVHLDMAVHHIVKAGHALAGDLLADDVRLACGKALFHFLLGQLAAAAVVVGHLTGSALLGVQSFQPLLGAEAVIGLALCHQLLFHASMPMNADGTLKEVDILGRKYKGEALLKRVGQLDRKSTRLNSSHP